MCAGQPAVGSPPERGGMGLPPKSRNGGNGWGNSIETEQTDVATLLAGLGSRLRKDGLALSGIACRDTDSGAVEHRDLTGRTGFLDQSSHGEANTSRGNPRGRGPTVRRPSAHGFPLYVRRSGSC